MGLKDFLQKGIEKPVEKPTTKPEFNTTNNPSTYIIKSGDSLSKIAKKFYGRANDWQKIFEANKDKIKDPDLIYPGQQINIP